MIEPAHLWVPPRVGSYGDEAIHLAELAGMEFDDEQKLAVGALASYKAGGQWAALEAGVVEARQNGKTDRVLVPLTLFDLFLMGTVDRIVWTAHLFKTSRDAFSTFVTCIDTAPELSRRVKKISYSHGEESIELHDGSLLEFLARSSGGGRGLKGKKVVFDEALFLQAGMVGALLPTLSSRPNPQVLYGSSAGKSTSSQLARLVKRGRAGGDPSLVWVEWCAPGSWAKPGCEQGRRCSHEAGVAPGCKLDDESYVQRANHAYRVRITVEFVAAERRAMPPEEFGRERLGWHETASDEGGTIDAQSWAEMLDAGSRRATDVALAVDIEPDRKSAAIGLYGLRADGLGHMQVMDHRPGTDWIVPRLVELRDLWAGRAEDPVRLVSVVMGRNTFKSLGVALKGAGFVEPEDPEMPEFAQVLVVAGGDMAAACARLLDVVAQGAARHIGQAKVDAAVAVAQVRQTSDAIAWSRKDSDVPLSPLMVLTLALWGYEAWVDVVDEEVEPWAEFGD